MSHEFRKVYLESLKGGQKKLDKDKDGKIEKSDLAKLRAEEVINEGEYEKAEENKRSADAAKKQGDMFAHHLHMSDHHENLSKWHSDKGRHGEAARHADKAEDHHEKSMGFKEEVEQLDEIGDTAKGRKALGKYIKKAANNMATNKSDLDRTKSGESHNADTASRKWANRRVGISGAVNRLTKEEVELDEATPYYNKPSFLKRMSAAAKQERLAREKKEREAKTPVKEESELEEAKYNHNDNRRGFGRREREDDEYHVPDPEIKKNKVKKEGYEGKGNHRPGWMLKADPELGKKVKAAQELAKKRKASYGNPDAGKSVKEEAELDEAAKGHTMEAHGVKGMKNASWRKTFKSHDHAVAWADKNDAEIHGTRDLEQAKKGNLSPAVREEVELDEARVNGREYASHGLMHPDHAKMDIHKVSGQHVDFYASKTGDKMQGKVVKNDGKEVHIQAHSDKEIGDGKLHKFKVKSSLPKTQNEGLDIKKSGMGDVIKDFKKSDAPQFKGKSAAKRRQMAIAAKLEADRMKNEEVEQLDEIGDTAKGRKALGQYIKKAANDKADTAFHHGYSAYNNSDHKPYSEPVKNKVHDGQEKRNKGIKRAVARLTREELKLNSFKSYMQEDLDEAAWPGTPEYKKKFPETSRGKVGDKKVGAKGTQTVTSTGVKHERDYEKAEKETGSTETQEKRGRGRPAGSKSGARN